MNKGEILNTLEDCELFRGLDREEIEQIAGLASVKGYNAGESIFCQGDFGGDLYVIAEGHVVLERAIDVGARKGSATIGVLGKGRTLGCWATLLGAPHTLLSSATCVKASKIITIQGLALRQIMLRDTLLGFRVMEGICTILRERLQGAYGAMERI
jgi:CRP/FNR family cyclic AMP-dependent transcriptional regulator